MAPRVVVEVVVVVSSVGGAVLSAELENPLTVKWPMRLECVIVIPCTVNDTPGAQCLPIESWCLATSS